MENFSMNWLAILVSALIPLIIGAIWYHPKVFGTAWMHATGITEAKIKTMSSCKGLYCSRPFIGNSFFLLIHKRFDRRSR